MPSPGITVSERKTKGGTLEKTTHPEDTPSPPGGAVLFHPFELQRTGFLLAEKRSFVT